MRLPVGDHGDDASALATVAAAVEGGVSVFDTAHAYGPPGEPGHNERLLARALGACGASARARVVTKGGMRRRDGAWVADGRAKAIRADCEASLAALDGLPIDLYLLHAPDPRTPWPTSLRALARIGEERLARHVGVANVNAAQLAQARALVPVAAVQVALSPFDTRSLRGGLVAACGEAGIALIAHSPLGGPRRAGGLARRAELVEAAAAAAATPAEVALAWLLQLDPGLVAIPGAGGPQSARSAARAGRLELRAETLARLDRALGGRPARRRARTRARAAGEVVLVMGIPGAGKSRLAAAYTARGYARLNRDERGGSLAGIAGALEHELAAGVRRIVLDNTYLTRALRSDVVQACDVRGVGVGCVWLDTPLEQAQANLVERLLDRFGALPGPAELRALARREPGVLTPTAQMRALRELEPPSDDEGFVAVERRSFARERHGSGRCGAFVAAAALASPHWRQALDGITAETPLLVFDWRPGAAPAELAPSLAALAAHVTGPVEAALCPHPTGPPACWCRPPLPGLVLAFTRAHTLDPASSLLVGTGPAHRRLAATLAARYVEVVSA
jgi:aryl-alcohol dehydrogenase-like predicted oxidoreductase/predicted kinase